MSVDEIVQAMENAGVRVRKASLVNALNRAGNRIAVRDFKGVRKCSVMIPGRREVEPLLSIGKVGLLFIEGGQPRAARRKLEEILGSLSGDIIASDPWYGLRTLDTLELIPKSSAVRFLSEKTNENPGKLAGPLADFKKERPNVELRIVPGPGILHDRYILNDDKLLILGHGLKDIGNKESFVILIERSMAPDLFDQLKRNFETRWRGASSL